MTLTRDSDNLTWIIIWKHGEYTVYLLERDRRLDSQTGGEGQAALWTAGLLTRHYSLHGVTSAHLRLI